MKLGWLWLSILNTTASPSPISITPAFSPGPWITQGALVGSVRRWIFDDLYEQCSFHIAEKMPSSVKVGVRPISWRMRSYSSGLRPCAAISAGLILVILLVILGCLSVVGLAAALRSAPGFRLAFGLALGLALAADVRSLAFCAFGVGRPVPFRDVF